VDSGSVLDALGCEKRQLVALAGILATMFRYSSL
jgi:hypothetical protein